MSERVTNRRIGLVFPVLPPVPNGIGDYTARLATTLAKTGDCSVFAESGSFDDIRGAVVFQCHSDFSSADGLLELVQANPPDALLVQYNPFSYGRWGLNLKFPETIRKIRKQNPGIRIGLMVHEAFVPTDSVKQTIMTTWQRYQLLRLGNASDIIFFSIDPWVKRFSRWFPNKPVVHAPVGSNIPRRSLTKEQARVELGIELDTFVVGAFGSNHESRLWDWVVEAAEAIGQNHPKPLLLYAGSAGELLRGMVRAVPFRDLGRVPTNDLSAAMTAMDIFLSPFSEGISSRKGSAIIGLQHGVPTLTSCGPQTDALFREAGLDLTDSTDRQAFVDKAVRMIDDKPYRDQLAGNGLGLHSRVFEWDVVAEVFQRAFEKYA